MRRGIADGIDAWVCDAWLLFDQVILVGDSAASHAALVLKPSFQAITASLNRDADPNLNPSASSLAGLRVKAAPYFILFSFSSFIRC